MSDSGWLDGGGSIMGKIRTYVGKIGTALRELGINKGDKLYVSSDVAQIIKAVQNKLGFRDKESREYFLRCLTEEIKNIVTSEGTLLFPMYNWDFCKGVPFDYHKTKSTVGALNNFVHDKFPEFRRTQHPLYSFMVWGKDQDYLCGLHNQQAFGINSPFGFLDRNGGKQLALGVAMSVGITFCHYLEQLAEVPYRHHKFFLGGYIDENGCYELRSYSQFVRDLNISSKYIMDDSFYIRNEMISQVTIDGWKASLVSFSDIRDSVMRNLKNGADFMYKFCDYDIMKHFGDDRRIYEVGMLKDYKLI